MAPSLQQLLTRRIVTNSRPGQRQDPYQLALLVGPGGMAGVITAAQLCALEEMGARWAFDDIYGISAGAGNAAYFMAGRSASVADIYTEELTRFRMSDHILRPLRRQQRPSEFLMLDCFDSRRPICWDSSFTHGARLHLIATRVSDGQAVDLGGGHDPESRRLRIWASGQVPVIGGPAIEIDGERYYDGGMSDVMPVQRMLDDGATHLLVLNSLCEGAPLRLTGALGKLLTHTALQLTVPSARAGFAAVEERYRASLELMARATQEDWGHVLWAPQPLSSTELDQQALQVARQGAYQQALGLTSASRPA